MMPIRIFTQEKKMTMNKFERQPVSKRTRFEVFKRDAFTCQYCGKSAPDVILEVDHIDPVSKGGKNHLLNLVTSCWDCNRGKSNVKLSDNSVVEKQRKSLIELNEKQEQLRMLLEWRSGLLKIEDQELEAMQDNWLRLSGYTLSESGIQIIKKLRKDYGLVSVFESMDITTKYFEWNDEKVTKESVEYAFNKIKGICYLRSLPEDKRNEYQQIGKLKYSMKYRFQNCNEKWMAIYIKQFLSTGHTIDELEGIINNSTSYQDWESNIQEYL